MYVVDRSVLVKEIGLEAATCAPMYSKIDSVNASQSRLTRVVKVDGIAGMAIGTNIRLLDYTLGGGSWRPTACGRNRSHRTAHRRLGQTEHGTGRDHHKASPSVMRAGLCRSDLLPRQSDASEACMAAGRDRGAAPGKVTYFQWDTT